MAATYPPTPGNSQHYRTARGWRIFTYLLAPPLIALFLAAPVALFRGRHDSPGLLLGLSLLLLAMAVFFALCLLETHKARHIITADYLLYEGAFYRKALPLANLRGFRIDRQYTRFFSRDPADPRIRIGYTSERYEQLQQWFAERYPNLDEQEAEAEAAQLLAAAPTAAPEQLEAALASARQAATMLNLAGAGVGAWLLFWPRYYPYAAAAGGAVPLLAVGALWLHRGLLRPDAKKASVYPDVFFALFLPAAALALRMLLDVELVRYAPLWPVAGTVALGFGLLLYLGGRAVWRRSPNSRVEALGAVLLCSFAFGYGTTMAANYLLDDQPVATYATRVLGKRVSTGKTTTYYLRLGAWGPRPAPEEVSVSAGRYRQQAVGDPVRVQLWPGYLHIPWLSLGD